MAVDLDVYTPFGDDDASATPVFQDQWNLIFQGVTGDGSLAESIPGERLAVTADGTSTSVTVTNGGGSGAVLVAGHLGRVTSNKTLNIDAGGAPGVGVRRIDWIVARVVRAAQKIVLDVIPGDPGTDAFPDLVTDRGGDLEVPLAWIDRTGPVNVTQAMITGTSARPMPGFFVGYTGGASIRPAGAPDGSLLVQGHDLFTRVNSGGVMTWRELQNPGWTNLSLASGMSYPGGERPAYRTRAGGLDLKGVIRRTVADWTAGATLATFPASVMDLLGGTEWTKHRECSLFPTSLAVGSGSSTTVRVRLVVAGGTISLPRVSGASAFQNVELDGIRIIPDMP